MSKARPHKHPPPTPAKQSQEAPIEKKPEDEEWRPLLTDDQRADEAGEESFPASDPPSWTTGITPRATPPAPVPPPTREAPPRKDPPPLTVRKKHERHPPPKHA